jgi:hypothetical protein
MRRALPVILALVALAIVSPFPAGACSCVARTLDEQVAAASAVFRGVARSVEEGAASFDVARVFKGPAADSHRVATGDPASTCAVPIVEGRTYVVFAAGPPDALSTNLCAGTTDDASVADRLAASYGTSSPSARPKTHVTPPVIGTVKVSRNAPIGVAAGILALVTVVFILNTIARGRPRPIA